MIVLGVPTTGSIKTRVVGSIQNLMVNRPDIRPLYIEGSLVYDARCRIVNHARQNGADLLFVDSDIEFDLEAFDRLLWRDTDIVSGLYFGRHAGHTGPIAYKTIKPSTIFRKEPIIEPITEIKPYMEVAGAGLGFCLIKNKVLMSFDDRHNPFEPFGNMGEDFSFFYRCHKNGFKVMLDTTFNLNHLGEYAYSRRDWQNGNV